MSQQLYVMLMENKNPLNPEVVQHHVDYLKKQDASGRLVLCGPFTDYNGGMVIYKAASFEEAADLANNDPFIKEGYKTFELRTLEWANKDNNYLLD